MHFFLITDVTLKISVIRNAKKYRMVKLFGVSEECYVPTVRVVED